MNTKFLGSIGNRMTHQPSFPPLLESCRLQAYDYECEISSQIYQKEYIFQQLDRICKRSRNSTSNTRVALEMYNAPLTLPYFGFQHVICCATILRPSSARQRNLKMRLLNSALLVVLSFVCAHLAYAQIEGAAPDGLPDVQCPSSPQDRQLELEEVSTACGKNTLKPDRS